MGVWNGLQEEKMMAGKELARHLPIIHNKRLWLYGTVYLTINLP